MSLRIIYAGTPDFSVPALQALIDSEHDVVGVYCQPDRPSGRGRKLTAGPVKQCALDNNIPVFQPLSLRDEDAQAELSALKPDLMVVAAYGLILPPEVLDAPTHGCFNIHASILPRWRGAAPIHRAILAGDKETGITIMQMDVGLDTGDMLYKSVMPIMADDTGASLHDKLSAQGAPDLMFVIEQLQKGELQPQKQDDSLSNYAKKLFKDEAKIDWAQPAAQIERQVRAFNPWPVAQTPLEKGMLRIWLATTITGNGRAGMVVNESKDGIDVGTGDGLLRITRLQLPGKKPMDAAAFLNANSLKGKQFEGANLGE